jgi:hypothetical protein
MKLGVPAQGFLSINQLVPVGLNKFAAGTRADQNDIDDNGVFRPDRFIVVKLRCCCEKLK